MYGVSSVVDSRQKEQSDIKFAVRCIVIINVDIKNNFARSLTVSSPNELHFVFTYRCTCIISNIRRHIEYTVLCRLLYRRPFSHLNRRRSDKVFSAPLKHGVDLANRALLTIYG